MSEPINLYKIKWIEPSGGMGSALERIAFVLADNIEQIAKKYPRLESAERAGVAIDLRK